MDNTVTFKYLFNEDYDPNYVNGVQGGVNPDGELIMNFYFERTPLPYELVYRVNDDGDIENEPCDASPVEPKIIRTVKSGIVVDKDFALTLYQWLGDQLLEMGVDINELQLFGNEAASDDE